MTSAPFDPPLSNAERAALAARWNAHPGIQHMGVRIDLSAPDVVRVYVDPVQPHHRGALVHGSGLRHMTVVMPTTRSRHR